MSTIPTGQGHELKFAPITASASGATAVVAAVTDKKIRVTGYVVVAATAVTVKFQSGTTDLTGAMPVGANGGVGMSGQPSSHLFETASGAALNINLGSAVSVAGHLSYVTE